MDFEFLYTYIKTIISEEKDYVMSVIDSLKYSKNDFFEKVEYELMENDFNEGLEVVQFFALCVSKDREKDVKESLLEDILRRLDIPTDNEDNSNFFSDMYNKYIDRVGTVISAEVYQIWKKEMLLLDDEGNELLLPKTEQIPSDFYRKGETARAVVARVDNKNNNPKIILSRTSPVFLQRLFEMEVPEINDGLITIKKIARIPGERAKIAVESYDDRIDPVGACVGVKGSRIHGIVRELRNENIDVINYTSNIQLFIQRALSPAKISSIVLHEEEKKAEVYLKPEEVSLAIGKGGMNIKLASMLTEYTIDVYRELDESAMDEDIYLDEFKDEIDEWVITAIKNIGLDTAKAVLNAPREMLIEKADLEENTVDDVLRVLRAEFEE